MHSELSSTSVWQNAHTLCRNECDRVSISVQIKRGSAVPVNRHVGSEGQLLNGEMPHFSSLSSWFAGPARVLLGGSWYCQKWWHCTDRHPPAVQKKRRKMETWSETLPPSPPLPIFLSFSPRGNLLLFCSYSSLVYVPFFLIVILFLHKKDKPLHAERFCHFPRVWPENVALPSIHIFLPSLPRTKCFLLQQQWRHRKLRL